MASGSEDIVGAYDRWANSYDVDRNLTRDLDASVTAEILGSRSLSVAVEAGCGTGKNTDLFARLSKSVIAMDSSAGMLARARERVRAGHVRFLQADLTMKWPCTSAMADLVSCNLVLEHIEDMTLFFLEAARVLLPDGLLLVCELHPLRQYLGSQARFAENSGAPVKIRAFLHHASDFTRCAADAGMRLERFDEWWRAEDAKQPPRLISFLFRKGIS